MILTTVFLRPLRRRPLRFLATVAGVAVGVASVVATSLGSRAALSSFREGSAEISGRTFLEVVRPGGLDGETLARLQPLTDDAWIVPRVEESLTVPALGDTVRLLGIDLLVDDRIREVEWGRTPDGEPQLRDRDTLMTLLREPAVLLTSDLAAECGVQAGDRWPVRARARKLELKVAGVFEPPRMASLWNRVALCDIATAQELFGRETRIDRIEVRPRPGADPDAVRASVERLVGPDDVVRTPAERRAETARMVRALEFNLTALSGISLLVGTVLVAMALATSVVQRRRLLATLRSLGASRRQIRSAVLAEAAAIGIVGGGLGLLGGIVLAGGAVGGMRQTLATVVEGATSGSVRVTPLIAAGAILLGLCTALVAAWLPMRDAERVPALQNLRSEPATLLDRAGWRKSLLRSALLIVVGIGLTQAPPIADLPIFALLASLALLCVLLVLAEPAVDLAARIGLKRRVETSPALTLACSGIAASRRRAAWAAGAVGIAVALAAAMGTMVHSFRSTVINWTDHAMRSDLWIRPRPNADGIQSGRLDPEVVTIAERLFGDDQLDAFRLASARVQGQTIPIGGGSLRLVGEAGGFPMVGDADPQAVFRTAHANHQALINESLARRFGYEVGDDLEFLSHSGAAVRRIAGIYRDYSSQQGRIALDLADFLTLYPDEGAASIGVYLPAGMETQASIEAMRREMGGRFDVEVLDHQTLRGEILGIFDRTFAITRGLQMVAALVAVLAVWTVLFALVRERRAELAVLSAIGASKWQRGGVVVAQAGVLATIAAAFGIVFGLAVGVVLVEVVNVQSFRWTLQLTPPWPFLALTALAVIPAALVAAIPPAAAAARGPILDVLREEESA